MQFCSAHRPPRAGIDPIECAEQALAVIALAIERPPVAETIVLLLDHERRGVCVTVVSGTTRPDDAVEVAECLATTGAHTGRLGAARGGDRPPRRVVRSRATATGGSR